MGNFSVAGTLAHRSTVTRSLLFIHPDRFRPWNNVFDGRSLQNTPVLSALKISSGAKSFKKGVIVSFCHWWIVFGQTRFASPEIVRLTMEFLCFHLRSQPSEHTQFLYSSCLANSSAFCFRSGPLKGTLLALLSVNQRTKALSMSSKADFRFRFLMDD